jgi:hypothetical protein
MGPVGRAGPTAWSVSGKLTQFQGDSDEVRDVALMIAKTLGPNPRRLKQFISLGMGHRPQQPNGQKKKGSCYCWATASRNKTAHSILLIPDFTNCFTSAGRGRGRSRAVNQDL